MKYILLMSGTKAGVDTYQAWSPTDIEMHMNRLRSIVKDLTDSGEFVATQGLSGPHEAIVVRGEKNGLPVTDGIFPESKEFLLGYWIVDVATPERAYAIAAQLSAASGPNGTPTNMPIEVRQFVAAPPAPHK
ncbi:MAG: YciI family protein [Terracidiphilus sp.]